MNGHLRNLRLATTVGTLSLALLALTLPASAHAEDDAWTVRIEPTFIDADGHDPHVLTIVGSAGTTAVALETDAGFGHQASFRRTKSESRWGWGVDFFWFTGAQNQMQSAAAAGTGDSVAFQVPEASFTSTGPGEVLVYERQPDTDMNAWTLDLYALRRASETESRTLWWLFGIRSADFDNDYHASVGVEGIGGVFFDGASNYGRMTGPIIGILGETSRGRNRFQGYLGQSLVFGDADLSMTQSDFEGVFQGETQVFTAQRTFRRGESVSIPITELRLRWAFDVSRRFSFGLGAAASRWGSVSVPPGSRPNGGLDTLYESTITFIGWGAFVEVDF